MTKKYAVIHCDTKGQPYEIRVTDGKYTNVIPVTNSNLSTCKKAINQMYSNVQIWVSREVESE